MSTLETTPFAIHPNLVWRLLSTSTVYHTLCTCQSDAPMWGRLVDPGDVSESPPWIDVQFYNPLHSLGSMPTCCQSQYQNSLVQYMAMSES